MNLINLRICKEFGADFAWDVGVTVFCQYDIT